MADQQTFKPVVVLFLASRLDQRCEQLDMLFVAAVPQQQAVEIAEPVWALVILQAGSDCVGRQTNRVAAYVLVGQRAKYGVSIVHNFRRGTIEMALEEQKSVAGLLRIELQCPYEVLWKNVGIDR